MTRTLTIRREAEADITAARQYYEQCRAGLGDDFLLCVEETLERVTKFPSSHKAVRGNIRRALIHRFPYGVFYLVSRRWIVVIAVLHARQSETHWQRRS